VAQVSGLQLVTQVFVEVSQVAPLRHSEQLGLQSPSPRSQTPAPMHPAVVQSGGAALHRAVTLSQVCPVGQSELEMQPWTHDSVVGSQDSPGGQPVTAHDGGTASQVCECGSHSHPRPQSEACWQPAWQEPLEQ
jgi:hypothetical protein